MVDKRTRVAPSLSFSLEGSCSVYGMEGRPGIETVAGLMDCGLVVIRLRSSWQGFCQRVSLVMLELISGCWRDSIDVERDTKRVAGKC